MNADVFDLFAEEYDRWFDSPIGSELFNLELEAVKLITKDLEHHFLEVGIGSGRFAEKLEIDIGIDPSFRVLEIARRHGSQVVRADGAGFICVLARKT
jgi:ubiquinone/menaquinone biosynthesis C-methylase UbiE